MMSGSSCGFALWVAGVCAPASATEGTGCPPDIFEPITTFDAGEEGFSIANLNYQPGWFAVGGAIDWNAGGGHPGGWITNGEPTSVPGGPTYYFAATTPFYGDRERFFGGALRLDVRREAPVDESFCPDCADVILVGPSSTLQLELDPKPPGGGEWVSYELSLAPDAGWYQGNAFDPVVAPGLRFDPSEATFRGVLSELQGVVLRADATGQIGVDNVALSLPVEADADGDGHHALVDGGDDCNDQDPAVHPCADEIWYDGIDEACDGGDDNDADGDGYAAVETGGVDCDDSDPNVQPDAWDPEDDAVDSDCSERASGEGCGCTTRGLSPWPAVPFVLGTRRRRARRCS